MNYTTLCSAKTFLGIPDANTAKDARIRQLLPQVTQAIRKWTGRDFGVFERTEYYSGDGTPTLILLQRPVVPDSLSVWTSESGYWGQGTDPFPDSSLLVDGKDFALEIDEDGMGGSGILRRIGGVWGQDRGRLWVNESPELATDRQWRAGNIKVQYTAGVLPDDLQLAANMTISEILQIAQKGSKVTSESYEDYSYTLAPDAVDKSGYVGILPPRARALLAEYRDLYFA